MDIHFLSGPIFARYISLLSGKMAGDVYLLGDSNSDLHCDRSTTLWRSKSNHKQTNKHTEPLPDCYLPSSDDAWLCLLLRRLACAWRERYGIDTTAKRAIARNWYWFFVVLKALLGRSCAISGSVIFLLLNFMLLILLQWAHSFIFLFLRLVYTIWEIKLSVFR